ncbi:atypical chemokine receptor 1 [Manis javanica]|uniref:atypical chemokine receptor 1 n=1 Tax=Manis javanica TaxID=9974 RepID=UPI00187A7597|nr:atypical chemokine receptor 1 [Manis javanica]
MGRQWVWGEAKVSWRPPQRLSQGPAQSCWPSLAPHTYLGSTAGSRTSPALLPAWPEPSSTMGNCLHPVPVADDNSTQLAFGDDIWDAFNENDFNESYELDYSDSNLQAAAPCRSCTLLDASSLPFFILASVLGILAGGAVLFALLRPLFHWQRCPERPMLVPLAVGSALFSIVVPILAPGPHGAHNTAVCHLAYLVWYSSAFAQALLIGCQACLGPQLHAGWAPGLTQRLTVGLWGVAALLALPITLASDTSQGLCTLTFSRGQGALQLVHVVVCFVAFVLLPLGLLGVKGVKKALGRGQCPWVSILWVWFIFWWPHGAALGLDYLVRSKVLALSTCLAQQALDLLLQLAEALAVLHCVATPLLVALFCRQASGPSLPSLFLSERQPSHSDTLGSKS